MTEVARQDRGSGAPGGLVWWHVALVAIFAMSTLKAVSLPIHYPASFLALSYDFGFVRRALPGEILALAGITPTPAVINAFGLFFFALLGVMLWGLARPMLHSPSRVAFLLPFVLAASVAIVYMAATIGYFDHLLLCLAIVMVLVRPLVPKAIVVLVLGAVAILIHEAALLMCLPVGYFSLLMTARDAGNRYAWPLVVGIAAFHVVMTYAVATIGLLPADVLPAAMELFQSRIDIEIPELTAGVISVVPEAGGARLHMPTNLVAHVDSIIIILPTAVFVFLCLFVHLGARADRLWVLVLAAAAGLAPLLLQLLSHDLYRWSAIALISSFIVFYEAWRSSGYPVADRRADSYMLPLGLVAVAVGAATTTFLVTHRDVDFFPYFELRQRVLSYLLA